MSNPNQRGSSVSKFSEFFTRLMGHEGGYSNNPSDPGGETMWGVTKVVARKYGYNGPMKQLPKATAEKIANAMSANYYHLEQLSQQDIINIVKNYA